MNPESTTKPEDEVIATEDKYIHSGILLHIAIKNLISKRLRSFLTIIGVVIGVGAIFFLLSFGLGVQKLVTNQVIGNHSLKAIDIQSPNSKIVSIDRDFVRSASDFAHVTDVGVQYSFPGVVSTKGGEVDSVVYGMDKVYQQLSNFTLLSGRLLSESDEKAVVINKTTAESLGISNVNESIGSKVSVIVPLEKFGAKQKEIRGELTLVGIISTTGGNEVYLPSALFDQAEVPAYSQAKVVVDDVENANTVRKQIESKGFETNSLVDTLDEINNIFKFFNLILIGFGSIGMIVAVLGMFNTLTISLLERTQEIGLMMSIGARRRDVKKLFTLEAVIISGIGAIVGMMIAAIIGQMVNTALNLNAKSRGVGEWFFVFDYPWWAIVGTFLATILVGLLVVYIPARRASRTNPVTALQRE